MGWTKYIPEVSLDQQEIVSILPTGEVCVNARLREHFEEFPCVVLLFDKARNVIGLQLTDEVTDSIPVDIFAGEDIKLSVKGFLDHFGIPYEKKRTYKARYDEDERIVEVNLNKPI